MNTRKLWYIAVIAILVVAASAVPAKADTVYTNGAIDGNTNARTINFGWDVSNSFTVGTADTLVSATIGLWAFPGDTLTAVTWDVGTSFFANDVATGTDSAPVNTFQFTNGYGYDIYSTSIAISGSVAPGTYYLSLHDAVTTFGQPIYWDQNSGPSLAMQNNGIGSVASESFTIFGSGGGGGGTPEPASLLLLGSGLLGLAGGIRKRMKA
jgi:hypothetical protein